MKPCSLPKRLLAYSIVGGSLADTFSESSVEIIICEAEDCCLAIELGHPDLKL